VITRKLWQKEVPSWDEASWTNANPNFVTFAFGQNFSQYQLNTNNRFVDLNCSLAPLRYLIAGNDLEGITNVVV